MASMPLYSQPSPSTEVVPQHSSSTSGHSNIGPFIAVLIIVTILCIVASIIGRLCSGKAIMGYGDYDMERWAETRCSSCIDGQIIPQRPSPSSPPPSQPPVHQSLHHTSSESEGHVVDLDETDEEKQESLDHEPQQQTASSSHHSS